MNKIAFSINTAFTGPPYSYFDTQQSVKSLFSLLFIKPLSYPVPTILNFLTHAVADFSSSHTESRIDETMLSEVSSKTPYDIPALLQQIASNSDSLQKGSEAARQVHTSHP